MERNTISIYGNTVVLSGNNIWMTDYEIADQLGVTLSVVNCRIKSIYKSGALRESDTYRYIHLENGNRADVYNMEMITALAFGLNSLPAKVFRAWVVKKAVTPIRTEPSIVVQLKDNSLLC